MYTEIGFILARVAGGVFTILGLVLVIASRWVFFKLIIPLARPFPAWRLENLKNWFIVTYIWMIRLVGILVLVIGIDFLLFDKGSIFH